MQVVVGRIGRAHGIHGEVAVDVRTDDPEARFTVGSDLATDPVERGPLQIVARRPHRGGLLLRFTGVETREAAEALTGVRLVVDSDALPPIEDDEEFYDHQLLGLRVELADGSSVGEVTDVVHAPGTDLLAVTRPGGGEVLAPFVRAIVPVVDVDAGRLVLDPPPGLLEL